MVRKETQPSAAWSLVDANTVPEPIRKGGRPRVETAEDGLISAMLAAPGKAARLSVASIPDVDKAVRALRQAANRQDRTAVIVNDGTDLYVTLIARVTRPRKTVTAG